MKVIINGNHLTAVRGTLDQKYYGIVGAAGESRLLHFIKTELNKCGLHLIKTRMHKDGHLVNDLQQYLRTDKTRKDIPNIHIWNTSWAIEGAEVAWNKEGCVSLGIEYDIFGGGNETKQMEQLKTMLKNL